MAWSTGNAGIDGAPRRGWWVGHFIPEDDGALRASRDVELKWAVHPAGEARPEWVTGETRTTCIVLVSGVYTVHLAAGPVTLREVGDYVLWGPGEPHSWEAVEDSVVLVIRWPSGSPADA